MANDDLPLKLIFTRWYNSIRDWILEDVTQLISGTIVGGKLVGSKVSGTIPSTSVPYSGDTPANVAATATVGTATSGAPHADHVHKMGILTAKGDLLTYGTVPQRHAVGTDTYVLTADSSKTDGLDWKAPTTGTMTTIDTPDGGSVASVSTIVVDNGTYTDDGSGIVQLRNAGALTAPGDVTSADGDLIYRKLTTVSTLTVGFIGDSITANTPSGGSQSPPQATATGLSTANVTVTANNQGQGGATSADWLSAASSHYLTDAKAAFAVAGVRLVHIMLGTNDCKTSVRTTAADYGANLQSLVNDLVSNGYICVVSYPPYVVPGSGSGAFDATSLTLLKAYQDQINLLVNGRTVLQGDTASYVFFANNTSDLLDGIHPNAAGVTEFGTLWSNAMSLIVKSISGQVPWVRLPIGANDQVLRVSGGVPYWGDGVPGAILFDDTGTALTDSNGVLLVTD